MVLTKGFKELVQARATSEPAFAEALLREGIEAMLAGDVDAGKTVLRDYINATVGFEKLGEATATSPKSLMRMFGSRGNPQARNLFGVIGHLQAEAQLKLHVAVERRGQSARRARRDSAKTAA
ncbi:MAG TPA: transcriptional regulator [Roseiarcus sp.]|jgi:hypothetical protein